MNKFLSRKFLLCLAAMLGSIATSIYGLHADNSTVAIIGTICGIVSSAIYAGCEAYIDGKALDLEESENNWDA